MQLFCIKLAVAFTSICYLVQALNFVEYDSSFSEDEKKLSKALKISCKLNNAACKLKLKDYKEAKELCTEVLCTS